MKKKVKLLGFLIIILVIIIVTMLCVQSNETQLKTIKSDKQLYRIYAGNDESEISEFLIGIATMPFSILAGGIVENSSSIILDSMDSSGVASDIDLSDFQATTESTSSTSSSSSKDYSTTNIQVENVDEADITKTDGDYIYSISENYVIITDVINPDDIKIAARIRTNGNNYPEDIILYKDKLVVIEASGNWNSDTLVNVYDITDRSKPTLLKHYEIQEPYYTSRCIDNMLYVISTGNLQKESTNKVERYYVEDEEIRSIDLNNIKYLNDVKTRKQTIISIVDLDNVQDDIKVSSYLIDMSNAYVSENNIYLLDQEYDGYDYAVPLNSIFGIKGIWGALSSEEYYGSRGYFTSVYKFNILENGNVVYDTKVKVPGKIINQYSVDEYNNNLRLALYDNDGTRVMVLDENLKPIGLTPYVAKGERMYSSRFMGDKAYLVTYKTIDPLFVIDLSDETEPKVLGELKIPGYSTYLHPYDENHLIGIGMETEEKVRKDSFGRVTSTTATITGMKMALFDVSDVNNPTQISSVVIGDSRTTSAILTNAKALLFSKEKELIAIPVNNYEEDFEATEYSSYESVINAYKQNSKSYIAEGYLVYNINLEEGFKQKGLITHELPSSWSRTSSSYNQIRGLYIEDNLYTISEMAIKVNRLSDLEEISNIDI